jgi:putative salt-induced outer membrane protein YdiY
VLKADGLYLRSTTEDQRTVDKTALGVRDEYKLDGRSFAFAETRYFRDVLKGIRYLVSPLVGLGFKVVDSERTQIALDGAVGGQFEKDDGRRRSSSGAVQAGERLSVKLSQNASLAQRSAALWKMGDFGDALYRFEVGVSASLARRFELKLAFLDDYKTRPANPLLKKNDSSIVAALVFKIG